MNPILHRLKREWQLITGDSGLLLILFIAPVFYTILYGSFYVNKTEYDVPIAVVSDEHGMTAAKFIRKLDAHPVTKVFRYTTLVEAQEAMVAGEVHGVLYIERDFEIHLMQQVPANIKLYLNNTRFFVSNDFNRAVNDVALETDAVIKLSLMAKAGITGANAEALSEPVVMEMHNIYNQAETYGAFILPGLLVLVLSQLLFISMGQNIGKERETGTLLHHHGSSHEIFGALTAKMILYSTVFTAYFCLVLYILYPAFGIAISGNAFTLLLLFVLFIITHSAFAMFCSTFFSTKLSGLLVVSFTTYPVFLVSGYAFPHASMPQYMVWIAKLLPSTVFLGMSSNLMFIPSSVADYSVEIMHLLILVLFYSIGARIRVSKLLQ